MSSSPRKWPVRLLRNLTIVFAIALFCMLSYTFYLLDVRHAANLGSAVIAIFGALALAFLALASPGALEELTFGPFKARWKIQELDARVKSLQVAVIGLINRHERSHLRKLNGEQDDWVKFEGSMNGQLERLEDLGYLKKARDGEGLEGIKKDGESKKDEKGDFHYHLKDYLEITGMGKEYLQLYREWAPPITVSRSGNVKISGKDYGLAKNWDDIVGYAMEADWISEPVWEDLHFSSTCPPYLQESYEAAVRASADGQP